MTREEIARCRAVLGVSPDASESEIKSAYRDSVKVWHPDKHANDPSLQQKAQDRIKAINAAFGALKEAGFPTLVHAFEGAAEPDAGHRTESTTEPGRRADGPTKPDHHREATEDRPEPPASAQAARAPKPYQVARVALSVSALLAAWAIVRECRDEPGRPERSSVRYQPPSRARPVLPETTKPDASTVTGPDDNAIGPAGGSAGDQWRTHRLDDATFSVLLPGEPFCYRRETPRDPHESYEYTCVASTLGGQSFAINHLVLFPNEPKRRANARNLPRLAAEAVEEFLSGQRLAKESTRTLHTAKDTAGIAYVASDSGGRVDGRYYFTRDGHLFNLTATGGRKAVNKRFFDSFRFRGAKP